MQLRRSSPKCFFIQCSCTKKSDAEMLSISDHRWHLFPNFFHDSVTKQRRNKKNSRFDCLPYYTNKQTDAFSPEWIFSFPTFGFCHHPIAHDYQKNSETINNWLTSSLYRFAVFYALFLLFSFCSLQFTTWICRIK